MYPYSAVTRHSSYKLPPSQRHLQELNYVYSRYSHTRRNTQTSSPPHYDPICLNNSEDYLYRDRAQLYYQLHQQKLINKRSNLIIQDLLQQKKRKKKIKTEFVHQKTQPCSSKYINNSAKRTQSTQTKTKKLPNQQNSLSTNSFMTLQTIKKNQHKQKIKQIQKKNSVLSPKTTPAPKQTAKQQILKKLYDANSPVKYTLQNTSDYNCNQKVDKIYGSVKNTIQIIKQIKQADLCKQEIYFLKEQLVQKNKNIVQLECQIIRLQKAEKMLSDIVAQIADIDKNNNKETQKDLIIHRRSMSRQKEKEKQKYKQKYNFIDNCSISKISQDNKQERKVNFCISNKFNIHIDAQRNSSKFIKCPNSTISVQRQPDQIKQQKIQIIIPEVQTTSIETQTSIEQYTQNINLSNKQQKIEQMNSFYRTLQFSSNTLSLQLSVSQKYQEQSQINVHLSKTFQQYSKSKFSQKQIRKTINQFRQCSTNTEHEEQLITNQSQIQTDEIQYKNKDCQTSQNYYDYIEKTYLEWIFRKDYEQMQAKKKNKLQTKA